MAKAPRAQDEKPAAAPTPLSPAMQARMAAAAKPKFGRGDKPATAKKPAAPIKPQTLRTRQIYDGKAHADVIREADPDGISVDHLVRRDGIVDRLLRNGSLGDAKEEGARLYLAAERFRADFERAQLAGHIGAVDLMRNGGGEREISDTVVAARQRVRYALGSLGFSPGTSHGSLQGKAAWWVLGCQETLEKFTDRMRASGGTMDTSKACGLVIAAIERLGIHYGLIEIKDLDQRDRTVAWGSGLAAAVRRLRRDAHLEEVRANYCRRRAGDSELTELVQAQWKAKAARHRVRAKFAAEEADKLAPAARRAGAAADLDLVLPEAA